MHSKRALIIKFGAIGDAIMAIPSVWDLHEQGFEVHWVCGEAVRPLLECYSWIHLIPVNDRAILRGRPWERIRSIVNLWKRTCGTGVYDLCAVLYYDKRYRILTFPIRARRKLVLSSKSRAGALLPGRHHSDEYARILLDLKDDCRDRSRMPIPPDRLPPSSWSGNIPVQRIAIVPGGAKNLLSEQVLRRWPIKNYVTLAECLIGRGWEVVLLGGREDIWVRSHFSHLAVTDRVDALSLPEVVSACESCNAVVTHDTGPLHLAGLSKTCLLGIFGPTNPATFVPRRPFAVGIWGGQGFACRPCYDGRDFAPCTFNGCMHQVTPELVLRELDRLLDDRSHMRPSAWRVISPDGDQQSAPGPFPVLPSI